MATRIQFLIGAKFKMLNERNQTTLSLIVLSNKEQIRHFYPGIFQFPFMITFKLNSKIPKRQIY